jgi:hypothetical protein
MTRKGSDTDPAAGAAVASTAGARGAGTHAPALRQERRVDAGCTRVAGSVASATHGGIASRLAGRRRGRRSKAVAVEVANTLAQKTSGAGCQADAVEQITLVGAADAGRAVGIAQVAVSPASSAHKHSVHARCGDSRGGGGLAEAVELAHAATSKASGTGGNACGVVKIKGVCAHRTIGGRAACVAVGAAANTRACA